MSAQPEPVALTPGVTPDLASGDGNQAGSDLSALTDPVKAALPVAFVVEDEETVGHLLVFILEREGFKVEWKNNGRDADRFIHQHAAPTIVLLDIGLPDIDGYGLLRLIRAHPPWKQTPVIMLTSLSQAKDVAKAMACGANDYMLKPFHPAELIKRVNKLCR